MPTYSSGIIAQRIDDAKNNGWAALELGGCAVCDDDLLKLLAEPGVEQLRALHLWQNLISTVPPQICRVSAVTRLDLTANQISAVPQEIGSLSALTMLALSGNRISTLPRQIGNLTNLKEVYLWDNRFSVFPSELCRLTSLTRLDFSWNRATSLPQQIGRLRHLTELYLSGNQITSLPPHVGELSRLESLYLEGNRLTSLPPEMGQLSGLTMLGIENNRLSTLPRELGRIASLKELYLHGNEELGIPPEILGPTWGEVREGNARPVRPADIVDFHFRTQTGATQSLNEAKLVLIGDGEVGKTALVSLLVHDSRCTGRERQTQRIEIVPWSVQPKEGDEIRLNVWDFGGQEIMHATHQFFLTKRTLYLVVVDARRGQNGSRLEYWLKLVASLAQDSPVIVVVNKIDEHELRLDENTIREKHGINVRDFAYVSCETGEGAEDLRKKIHHHILGLKHVGTKVPVSWLTVKKKLEKANRPWMTYGEYQEVCCQESVTEPKHQRQLIGFLHDLGVMLSFFHEDIDETRVLAPEWVTRGVYAIITSKKLGETNGLLRRSDLPALLSARDYPAAQRQFIVDMMRKFELCFAVDGLHGPDDAWLIPGRLDTMRPPGAELPLGALRFQYNYRVLPASIIARFMVRAFPQLDRARTLYWRNGIVLDVDGAKVRVIADTEDRRIDIAVTGDGIISRRAALTYVRTEFGAIHAALPGMRPEERVPLPDRPEIAVPYTMLLDLDRDPNTPRPYRWWCGDHFVELNVDTLLNGIETREERMGERESTELRPTGEVFLSYAHKDAKWRDELLTMLAPALGRKALDLWYDVRIKPSTEWRNEIEAAMGRARVGVLLVSRHFLASDFIANDELPFLITAAKKAQVKLSWVLISTAMYEQEQFTKLQALHDVSKPITATRGNNRDKVLKEIARGILDLAR